MRVPAVEVIVNPFSASEMPQSAHGAVKKPMLPKNPTHFLCISCTVFTRILNTDFPFTEIT